MTEKRYLLSEKEQRRLRRNQVAKDLAERKYHQRVIPKKKPDLDWDNQDWERF